MPIDLNDRSIIAVLHVLLVIMHMMSPGQSVSHQDSDINMPHKIQGFLPKKLNTLCQS